MEIVGFDDLSPLFVFNAERAVLDAVDRPVLPSVAGPDVDVFDPVELGAVCDKPVEQGLVDVDRAGIDEILVAGVDLRPDANVPETQKYHRNIGEPSAGLRTVGGEKAVLGDRGETLRDQRLGLTGLSAQERSAVRKLDGELGQEIVADDPELSFRRLKQKIIAGEMKIRALDAGKRDRR